MAHKGVFQVDCKESIQASLLISFLPDKNERSHTVNLHVFCQFRDHFEVAEFFGILSWPPKKDPPKLLVAKIAYLTGRIAQIGLHTSPCGIVFHGHVLYPKLTISLDKPNIRFCFLSHL